MPNYQRHIVYLSDEQRQELFTNGTITVDGRTITYSDNDMYVTPQEPPYIKPATGIPASDLAEGVIPVAVSRVLPLDSTPLLDNGGMLEAIGIPAYINDVTEYAEYGLSETGWYVFARITAPSGVTVTCATTVTGAAAIITPGADHVDVAVRFEVAAMVQAVTVAWGAESETFWFRASDLAVRNMDYRTTFYVYDISPFATWSYALTTDASFAESKRYYTESGSVYTLAEITPTDPVPAYYTLADETYTQATGVFEDGVTYYTKDGDAYTETAVTVGDPIPAYYNHSKVTFEGMARNVTYQLDEIIDCPQEYILPEIEDDGHGAWYEIRLRHAGSYSSTLVVPEGVKIATEHTQAETAGMNMVDLHYMSIDGIKIWRFMNTHSSIPTT